MNLLRRWRYRRKDMDADRQRIALLERSRFLPMRVAVQISRRCNLTCSMCGWKVWQRNRGFMSVETFDKVLGDMAANGLQYLDLSSAQGEPLLHPQAGTFIKRALLAGMTVQINTNCTTLGERNIAMLVEVSKSGKFVTQASFAGYDRESHESVYVGSRFEDSSRKLKALHDRLRDAGLSHTFFVNGIIMDAKTKQRHLDYLASLGITERIRLGLPDNFAGIAHDGSYKSALAYRSLRLCAALVNQIVVYDDGTVSACACRDSEGAMALGCIDDGILDMRNGAAFKGMVDDFMRRDLSRLPLCQKCDIPYGDTGHEIV